MLCYALALHRATQLHLSAAVAVYASARSPQKYRRVPKELGLRWSGTSSGARPACRRTLGRFGRLDVPEGRGRLGRAGRGGTCGGRLVIRAPWSRSTCGGWSRSVTCSCALTLISSASRVIFVPSLFETIRTLQPWGGVIDLEIPSKRVHQTRLYGSATSVADFSIQISPATSPTSSTACLI